jgi:hypothetical protein
VRAELTCDKKSRTGNESTMSVKRLADVTIATNNLVRLRCNAQGRTVQAAGQMIVTQVGTMTASEQATPSFSPKTGRQACRPAVVHRIARA